MLSVDVSLVPLITNPFPFSGNGLCPCAERLRRVASAPARELVGTLKFPQAFAHHNIRVA